MIAVTLSLDSRISTPDARVRLKKIGSFEELLTILDDVTLLTQDTSYFKGYLNRVKHVPCCVTKSRYLKWILDEFTYIRWAFFFFSAFFWAIKNRRQIRLIISLNIDSPAPVLSLFFGFPYIAYYHYDTSFQVRFVNKRPILGMLLQFAERFAFRKAKVVWVTSPSLVKKANLFGAKRIQVIPNFVDTKEIEEIEAPKQRLIHPRLLFVGRLHPVKQVDLLLKAFKKVLAKEPDARLDVIGDGEERSSLVALAKALEITERVNFRGFVNQKRVFELMKQSSMLILPSKTEGNPRVLIEAMLCRLPIIATDVPGINDMVKHLETGYLVDSHKPEDLALAITYIRENHHQVESMVNNAYAFAHASFSKEKVMQLIQDEINLIATPKMQRGM